MSEIIIKAENLGKKYIISHEGKGPYKTLRDQVMHGVKNIFSKTNQLLLGQQRPDGVESEEFWALKQIDFEIKKGDRLGIIGRNGAGKSTLLKILSRITEPTTGKVIIKGRVASLLEVGTGFHHELTGRENIFLNGAILGMSRTEIKRKFDEIVDFSGVEKFLDTPVKRYSSGMYVRLAFSVAAHLEPEILVVDEVLAVGDAQFQKKCLGKMEDVSKNEGRTVLFVSHNMGVVTQLCKRAILLKNGHIIANGNTDQVIQSYVSSDYKTGAEYNKEGKESLNKPNYFKRVFTTKETGSKTSDFIFNESIQLHFEFKISQNAPNLQIGIGLNDKYQNRVFTILRPVDSFTKKGSNEYSGKVTLPSGIIAPNLYSFAFAIWTKDGSVFEYLDNICPVKIHDDGTDLALYEGGDHGSVIVNPIWEDQ